MTLDSRLITGPPASGKSRAALDRFLSVPDSVLVTPSATMAEHLRHELARAGKAVRPGRVTTLAQFLETRTPLAPAPAPLLRWLIRQALEKIRVSRFAAVAEYPSFQNELAALFEEAPKEALEGDLARVFAQVESALGARGMALRPSRLRSAEGPWPAHVVFDGFFSLPAAELDLIARIAADAAVTLTLPDWPGAAAARQKLLAAGFEESRQTEVYRCPLQNAFAAPTLERETEEIARRILEQAARGREFREMGIILRVRDPYGLALETTLARFGIPARFYFADALVAHPAVYFLAGLVRAVLSGWDGAAVLTLLRMPVSGIGATPSGDQMDFSIREQLPGASVGPEWLALLDPWRREQLVPVDWAIRLKSLRTLLPEPVVSDRVSRDQLGIWRSTAAALEGFDAAMDATAAAVAGETPIRLEQFWAQAELTLSITPLRIDDRRRNVVHVLDVFEARQWELPIVFVCGLEERHFPQYHQEDSLLNDSARCRAGLKTSADRQAEERFLFELATTRATEEVVLSHARFNDKGEETLPSFFLRGIEAERCETRVRPKPIHAPPAVQFSVIQDAALLDRLRDTHKALSPSSIEKFLQCPFQFFANKTLRLRPRPPTPRDRFDVLVQGTILHRALATGDFEGAFQEEVSRTRIPATYRTEAVRLELLRHYEAFREDRAFALGWERRLEEEFSFALNPRLTIRGRIDRLEIGPNNEVLVIDYKYSAGNKIRERVEEHSAGNLVQGGLYLLAAKELGFDPAGMLYCGLRNEVSWEGWHIAIPGLEAVGESRTRAGLDELMQTAAARAAETFEQIAAGRIAPRPADVRKCIWCDFRDICRVESAATVLQAGSG